MRKIDRLLKLLKAKICHDFESTNGFQLNDDFFDLKSRKSMNQATEIITIVAKNAKKAGFDSNESLAKEIASAISAQSKSSVQISDNSILLAAQQAAYYLSKESTRKHSNFINKKNKFKRPESKYNKNNLTVTSAASRNKPFDPTFVTPANLDLILKEDNSYINSQQSDGKLMFRQAYMYAYQAYKSDINKDVIISDFFYKNLKRCAVLIKHGANPFAKDGRGFNAFDGTEHKFKDILFKFMLAKENINEYGDYAVYLMSDPA